MIRHVWFQICYIYSLDLNGENPPRVCEWDSNTGDDKFCCKTESNKSDHKNRSANAIKKKHGYILIP